MTFAALGVPDDLVASLRSDGITTPFAIQSQTLPDALAGRDLCGRAPTGGGKTLAFAIPLAARVGRARPRRPRGLVLLPTRELAAQVSEVLTPLADSRDRRVATFYGGTNLRRDVDRLRAGVDIAVATPGRLADLVSRGDLHLGDVDLVVLDEADRMADMGFLPVVTRLLDGTAADRQTLLFSATLDGDVDTLIRRYQRQPVRHEVAVDEVTDVHHLFWAAERTERRELTADIVRRFDSAIVFTRTKHGADRLARQLAKQGITTAAIHGNRSQPQRERALARFTAGGVQALVATDVAARGIHVDGVAVVVHFDLAGSDKDYVHRSGRTGRAGARGVVVSLIAEEEREAAAAIQRSLDLPTGLHARDRALLTASVLPAPRPSHEPAARTSRQQRSTDHRARPTGGQRNGRRRSPNASGAASARSEAPRRDTPRAADSTRTETPRRDAPRAADSTRTGAAPRNGRSTRVPTGGARSPDRRRTRR